MRTGLTTGAALILFALLFPALLASMLWAPQIVPDIVWYPVIVAMAACAVIEARGTYNVRAHVRDMAPWAVTVLVLVISIRLVGH